MMKEKLQNIKEEALKAIEAADMPEKLNDVRVKFLGKKGELTAVLKGMKDVAPEDRPKVGQMVNETRAAIEAVLEENKEKMEKAIRAEKLKKEVIDVTLPAKKNCVGHRHPNTIALEEVERVFTGMGYEVVEGPEIEYDEYNFRKLNIPDGHPATLRLLIFQLTIQLRMSRTHSILIKTSCSGHRHLLYRHVLWSRASFQSVSCHRDVYSVQTK